MSVSKCFSLWRQLKGHLFRVARTRRSEFAVAYDCLALYSLPSNTSINSLQHTDCTVSSIYLHHSAMVTYGSLPPRIHSYAFGRTNGIILHSESQRFFDAVGKTFVVGRAVSGRGEKHIPSCMSHIRSASSRVAVRERHFTPSLNPASSLSAMSTCIQSSSVFENNSECLAAIMTRGSGLY